MIDMMQKFCRGRRLGVPFSVYLHTWFGLPGVRVSGGHLCEAEAPTEPAGETHCPLHYIIFLQISFKQQFSQFAFLA